MSTISHPRQPARAKGPHGQRLWCGQCDTDQHLIIQSIQPLEPPRAGLVDAAYSCRGCGRFYEHPAAAEHVAGIVNGPGHGAGVLNFGGVYLHCGEPMRLGGSEHRSIYAPVSTEQRPDALLDVYLRTRVLRCGCGFQMEIPE